MSYNLFLSALLMAATYCSLFICYLTWKRRKLPIAVSYGLGMLTSAFYTFGYALEIVSTSLEEIRFWLRIEYIGIPFGTVAWFIMVLQYTGRQAMISKWKIVILLIVPMVTFIGHNTNEWHHWFYTSMTLDESQGFPLVMLATGPLYKLHVGYSYTFFVIGMLLLSEMYWHAAVNMKKQIAFMMIGSCGPYLVTFIYLSGFLYMPIDISPFGFVLSGVFFMWGIYQFNLLKLAPLALKKVFESMRDAVIVVDVDHRITSFNQAAKRFMEGFNHRKMLGQPVAMIFTQYPELLEKLEQDSRMETKVKIADQAHSQFYNVHISLISDNKMNIVGKMVLLIDVTEEVLAEERLVASAHQLSELNTIKDRLFHVIAHDIRDPLAMLVSLMEVMEAELQTSAHGHTEVVQEMGQQIQNTYTLVESLLDWFRSQREGIRFNPVTKDLCEVVKTNVQLLQLRSQSKHIHIHSRIPDGTLVYADTEMLDLIIRNLLSNAIKFTGSGGRIQLESNKVGKHIIVSVKDTGAGIAPEQADTLFQEAPTISLTGTAGEIGYGLGFTLCREFVRVNGGDIWFDSELGQGSTFYFSIPTQPDAALD